jgi:hypothetical protein
VPLPVCMSGSAVISGVGVVYECIMWWVLCGGCYVVGVMWWVLCGKCYVQGVLCTGRVAYRACSIQGVFYGPLTSPSCAILVQCIGYSVQSAVPPPAVPF